MQPSYPTNGEWTTRDELDFIRRLGQHGTPYLGLRVELLEGYLAGLELRTEATFDVGKARDEARRRLKMERALMACKAKGLVNRWRSR